MQCKVPPLGGGEKLLPGTDTVHRRLSFGTAAIKHTFKQWPDTKRVGHKTKEQKGGEFAAETAKWPRQEVPR